MSLLAEDATRQALSRWLVQRRYPGRSWSGVEALCLSLAGVADVVAVQSAGWYKYPGSLRPDMDGKDWRYVVPDEDGVVIVNCHSLLYDDLWTLATTVFETNEVDLAELKFVGMDDPWARSMLWSVMTARELATDGYDYSDVIGDMMKRVRMGAWLNEKVAEWKVAIDLMHEELFGEPTDAPDELVCGVNEWSMPEGKIGAYRRKGLPWHVLTVAPKAFENGMAEDVVKHELCHAAVGEDDGGHSGKFAQLSKAVGVPEEFRD